LRDPLTLTYGTVFTSDVIAHEDTTSATPRATAATSNVSVTICRVSRSQEAPSDARMAISASRRTVSARRMLAVLATDQQQQRGGAHR